MTPTPSLKQVEVFDSGLHGMNKEFVPAVEEQNDDLEQSPRRVEAQSQLPGGRVVIEVGNIDRVLRSIDAIFGTHAMLESGSVDVH
jgi:hypothetical protein